MSCMLIMRITLDPLTSNGSAESVIDKGMKDNSDAN